ncbi:MAG: hypothetical protein EOM59_09990 [Clostridia bacterium]|nr:hypothetical protein [Clostridia bacterium]
MKSIVDFEKMQSYYKLFLKDRKARNLSKSTINDYRLIVGYYLDFLELKNGLDFFSSTQDYIISLTDRNVSGTTIYTYIKHIKVFLRYLYSNGYITLDVASKIGVKLPKTLPEVLTIDEIKRLLIKSNARDRLIFMLLLDCGLRKGELFNLKVADVTKDYVFIRSGKGSKDRLVPISQNTYLEVKEYVRSESITNSSFNLIRNDVGGSLSYYSLQSVFRRAKKRCNIPRLTAHLLRHTYASYFLYNGGDVSVLSMLLGHSDLKITEKYIHLAGLIDLKKYSKYSAMHGFNYK